MTEADIIQAYKNGASSVHIALAIGSTAPTILTKLKKAGVEIRKGGARPEFPSEPILRKPQPPPVKHCVCAKPVPWKKHGGKWQCRKCLRLEA